MSASHPPGTDERPDDRPAGPGASAAVRIASAVLLFAAALAAGAVGGVYAGWLPWLWMTGFTGKALAAVTLAVLLAALYAVVRAVGQATEGQFGAVLCAAGWTLPQMAMVWGGDHGDIVFSASAINYVFLFGGVAAAMLGVVFTPPAHAR